MYYWHLESLTCIEGRWGGLILEPRNNPEEVVDWIDFSYSLTLWTRKHE